MGPRLMRSAWALSLVGVIGGLAGTAHAQDRSLRPDPSDGPIRGMDASATVSAHGERTSAPPSTSGSTSTTGSSTTTTSLAPKRAAWHPAYHAEVEVHGEVAGLDQFAAGVGGGVRLSFPLVDSWPSRRIDGGLAVGIGFDVVRYGAYRPTDDERQGSKVLVAYYFPVFAQWNWWTGRLVSVFGEIGLNYRQASYIDQCPSNVCAERSRVLPLGALGARFRVADHWAVTVRAGWPAIMIGASWL